MEMSIRKIHTDTWGACVSVFVDDYTLDTFYDVHLWEKSTDEKNGFYKEYTFKTPQVADAKYNAFVTAHGGSLW